jgi:hypothetical protein
MAANDPFYRTFQVDKIDTEGKNVYELGNGQWDIPALRKLLEEILPHNTFFNGFEVAHIFPFIGSKVMMLNARQIHYQNEPKSKHFPPIILLAFEDVTEMMSVAESLARKMQQLEMNLSGRTEKLEAQVTMLQNSYHEHKKYTIWIVCYSNLHGRPHNWTL